MPPSETAGVLDFAQRHLSGATIEDGAGQTTRLWRCTDSDGNRYAVKRLTNPERFDRELAAYQTHLEPIRTHVPELIAADAEERLLLLTWLPGRKGTEIEAGSEAELNLHHQAGHCLSRLHRASSTGISRTIGPQLADRLQHWRVRVDHHLILTTVQRQRIDANVRYLAATPMATSICHLDFQPRNWLLDHRAFHLLDFEHLRRDARIRDLARSWWRHWYDRPDLKDAFLTGYEVPLGDTDRRLLDAFGCYEALTAISRGHETESGELYDFGRNLLDDLT
ncbi:phosphotransferase enzyme family protein [Glycomyces dulcitolivorans]|uniref:phosphotransferase enzyme family protein n=1 Tax=Glycomyces dulcitolivorans TaxID=2200759 RepID=UPI000DD46FB8|nr:phosphotransferase [Glycomyces dulcitolivorans]